MILVGLFHNACIIRPVWNLQFVYFFLFSDFVNERSYKLETKEEIKGDIGGFISNNTCK